MIRLINQVDTLQRLLEAVAAVPTGQRLHIPGLRDALVNQADVLAGLQLLVAAGELDPATLRPPLPGEQQPLENDLAELLPPPVVGRVTGRQLAAALRNYAAEHKLSIRRVGEHLFRGPNAVSRLSSVAAPWQKTIDKVRAFIAEPPPAELTLKASGGPRVPEVGGETGAGLAAEVDQLIAREGLSITTVGMHLFGNRGGVQHLRRSNPRRATVAKVRAFLAAPPLDKLRPTLPPTPAPAAPPSASPPPARRTFPAAVPMPKEGFTVPARAPAPIAAPAIPTRPPLPSPQPPSSPMVSKLKPAEVAWCDQCDQRVKGVQVDKCQSRFCSLKKAAAA